MEEILIAPAIPLRGLIPIPGNEQRIEIGRLVSLNALEALDDGINDGKVISSYEGHDNITGKLGRMTK